MSDLIKTSDEFFESIGLPQYIAALTAHLRAQEDYDRVCCQSLDYPTEQVRALTLTKVALDKARRQYPLAVELEALVKVFVQQIVRCRNSSAV